MDVAKVCRLCGKIAGKIMYSIFSKNNREQQLIQLIKQYLPVVVYRTDPLSKEICKECYSNLEGFCRFQSQCASIQDHFKSKLQSRSNDISTRLYLDALENHIQSNVIIPDTPTRKTNTRNSSCQVSFHESKDVTKTASEELRIVKCVTILTPKIINESHKNSNFLVTASNEDGIPTKKRKIAGPKSKTKRNLLLTPPSLLQCALQRINKNLSPNSKGILYAELTKDTFENVNQASEDKVSTASNSDYISESEISESNLINFVFNPEIPVMCNYCMKFFSNSLDLSRHEINHIQVDIGPRIEDQEFLFKYRQNYGLYRNWRNRTEEDNNSTEENSNEQNKNYQETDSLLIPESPSSNSIFKVVNNEITVNDIPLKNYDKTQRRSLYKTIIVNGIKRKFCPICRHTFKDNWAIDIHYINSSCQYTCKYCGMKFKFHKELYPEHLKSHEGETCIKIFGPSDRRTKLKKRKISKHNRFTGPVGTTTVVPPKIKPIKMKHLLQKKANTAMVKIKTEPGVPSKSMKTSNNRKMRETVTLETKGNIQPYQAYFCRKCFKVFFKIDEFNAHTSVCTGTGGTENEVEMKVLPERTVKAAEPSSTDKTSVKRPVRSCVKELSILNDSDSESVHDSWSSKTTKKQEINSKRKGTGFECGICCSSFPSRHSRNSHMRIHKSHKLPDSITNLPVKVLPVTKSEPSNVKNVKEDVKTTVRLSNLNPTVARLVQNNPHLTIRSYTKPAGLQEKLVEAQNKVTESDSSDQSIKRAYRCSDCNGRYENKSLLYYHKLKNCVKKHYECAFCHKKFSGYEQYNSHMLYIHPE